MVDYELVKWNGIVYYVEFPTFLSDSMMKRSDDYSVQINESTGLIDYSENTGNKVTSKKMPYAMKMLLQELQSMSIYHRLLTEYSVSNKPVFNYLLTNIKR